MQRIRLIGVQRQRPGQCRFGTREVPLIPQDQAENGMRLRQLGVQRQRPFHQRLRHRSCLFERDVAIASPQAVQHEQCLRLRRQRRGVVGVQRERLVERDDVAVLCVHVVERLLVRGGRGVAQLDLEILDGLENAAVNLG